MKKYIISFLITIGLAYGISDNAKPGKYKDFGIQAEQYEIVEPDFAEIMKEEILKLKLSKKKVRQDIEKAVKKAARFDSDLKLCDKNIEEKWEKDYYILQTDLYNPMGRVWKKAGTKMLAPSFPPGIQKNICFIDGKNLIVAKNQINFFKEKFGDCLYLVSNMDVRELTKFFKNEKIYPSQYGVQQRFDLKCLPASLSFKEDKRKVIYYDYEYFKTNN